MRTIVHMSDLHFGSVDRATLQPLAEAVRSLRPDLVAVSGDVTQRARVEQFKEAAAFLGQLPVPQIVVPGNHDIPLDNVILRLFRPLSRFKHYMTRDLVPAFVDEEIAVLGLNSARRLLLKNGRVNSAQVSTIDHRFCSLDSKQIKIVVTHHPFDLPHGLNDRHIIGRSNMAMKAFSKCGVDLFLAGHLHLAHAGNTQRYDIEGYSALIVQAGTATSNRGRGEVNSFNVLRIEESNINLETHAWQHERQSFVPLQLKRFRRSISGWQPN